MSKLQEWKAAKYLIEVNPKRYRWERVGYFIHLIDRKSGYKTHSRQSSRCTTIVDYYDRVPIASFDTMAKPIEGINARIPLSGRDIL